MRRKFHEFEKKAFYDACKWTIEHRGALLFTGIGGSLFSFFKTASWPLRILVGVALAALLFVGMTLWRYLFPAPTEPSIELRIEPVPTDIWPPDYFGELSRGVIFRCEFDIHNDGELSAADLSVEICEMDTNPSGVEQPGLFNFPISLSSSGTPEATKINPGRPIRFILIDDPKVVSAFGKTAVRGTIGGQAGFIFLTGTNYRIKIKITAHDMSPIIQNFNLRFEDRNGICAFNFVPFKS